MNKKFTIIIEDDWELLGNGLGNVASHQYIPSLIFMKMAKKLDIKLTFMVDVAQQLEFIKRQNGDANIRLQKNLWDDCILVMKEYGFDVQLHLHPQWLKAPLNGDLFYLNNIWNIGQYNANDQQKLIGDAVKYLHTLIRPHDPNYQVIAFKGGSWGLQPSESLFKSLENEGIKIVMGVRQGMYIPENGVDYKNLEEEFFPYYPAYHNIQRISDKQEKMFIIPLQSYKPGFSSLIALGIDSLKQRIKNRSHVKHYYESKIDERISNLSPLKKGKKLQFSFSPYHTHLKIGNQPFNYLRDSFDSTIERFRSFDKANIPIVIESHTKQFHNHYSDIERFLYYIKDKYGDVVNFRDITTFYKDVVNNSSIIKTKEKSA